MEQAGYTFDILELRRLELDSDAAAGQASLQVGNRLARGQVAHFRVPGQVPGKDHRVDRNRHPSVLRLPAGE